MGLFKKLGKKLRGFFKRIGKGIKKGFQKFGKLMGKIGILGQIAMMFILPGIGSMMLKGLGSLTGLTATAGSAAATAGGLGTASGFVTAAAGSSSALAKSVAWTLKTAQRFANSPLLKPFKTVTGAINGFVKNTIGFVGQKLGLDRIATNTKFSKFFQDAPSKLYGKSEKSVFNELGTTIADNWSSFKTDIQQGDIFMSGDKELSLTKAYDTGLAEKAKTDSFFNNQGQAKVIYGDLPDDLKYSMVDATEGVSDTYTLQDQTRETALAAQRNENLNRNVNVQEEVLAGLDDTVTPPPKVEGFFSRMGDKITNLPQSSLDYAMDLPGQIGTSLLEAPGRVVSNMAVQSVMGGGGRGGPYWGSTAGPTYNPGRDRAEQYAYSSAMATAGATSDMFGSDYDYFTATQADQYGDDEGGTWGNYMGRQRVA